MAAYILNDNVAPRSWKKVPWAYYVRGREVPRPLKEDEFDVMLLCDGEHDLEPHFVEHPEDRAILENLSARGLVREAQPGETLSDWQRYRDCQNPVVPYITLEITQRCNFNCLHCFNAADMKVPRAELTYEQICDILDQALECGIQNVLITGGEPMLHPRFMDIMHAIYDRGITVYELNTNGYYLTPEILQEMKDSGMDPKMKISFDGLGFHDEMRTSKGCEERTLDAIALCVEYGFSTRVQMNMNRYNLDTILPTLLKLDEMGVDEIRVSRTTESPRWNITRPGGSILWTEFFRLGLEIAGEYIKHSPRMYLEYWPYLSVYPRRKAFCCWPVHYNPDTFKVTRPLCKCNRGNISVGANGRVYPCLQMSGAFDALDVLLGNVLETPLQELLSRSMYSRLAQACVQERMDRNGRCADCPFLQYCGGGCTLMGMIFNGDYFGADNSACVFHRDGWHAKAVATFDGWRDLAPIPDDIDPAYLVGLGIDEVPHIDMDALRESKFEI